MNIRDRRAIHQTAARALDTASGNPGNIALVYAFICSVMALAMTVVTGVLTDRIGNTGGLSNIGLRSILSTGQTVLPIVQLVVTACLNLGYQICVLRIARGQDAAPGTLMDGFRNFGPILRAMFFQMLLYFSYGFLTMYLSSFIFMMTPFAQSFLTLMEPVLASAELSGGLVLDEATLFSAMQAMIPMLWIWLGLFLLLFIPAWYGYRMVTFCIADNPRKGALASLHQSKMMLRRNRFALFRLDLTMWWFYALQILFSCLAYGDVILPMLGISLNWNPTFSYYFFFLLSLVLQVLTYYFLLNRVNVTYAVAYDTLLNREESPVLQEENLPFPTEY